MLFLSPEELLNSYGARSVNFHYLNQSEIEPGKEIGSYVYNSVIPHYQLAASLFSPNTADLLSYLNYKKLGYEIPHNYLHSVQKGIFLDGAFSLSYILFFPFHSWIDAMLEFRLRKDQVSSASKVKEFLDQPISMDEPFSFVVFRNNATATIGDYPVMEWSNPAIMPYYMTSNSNNLTNELLKNYTQDDALPIFSTRDYMLNS